MDAHRTPPRRASRGFSLVELLAVTAIITAHSSRTAASPSFRFIRFFLLIRRAKR